MVYNIINDYNFPDQLKGYLYLVCTGEVSETTLRYIYQKQLQQLDKKTFQYAAAKDWNDLLKSIRSIQPFHPSKQPYIVFC